MTEAYSRNNVDDNFAGVFDYAPMHEKHEGREVLALESKSWLQDHGDWVRFSSVMDSGCVDSIAPPELAEHVPVVPSAGSRRGQKYAAASGHNLSNLGEQSLSVVSDLGTEYNRKYQIAEVTRPLDSVSEVCDSGNRVVFGSGGGFIFNVRAQEVTPFSRNGKLHEIHQWLRKSDF